MLNTLKKFFKKKLIFDDEKSKFINTSYSQFGEDVIAFSLLNYKSKGFYVDVGSFHPYRYSNTAIFYNMGWKGINIDPTPGVKKIFDLIRTNDINIELGISENNKEQFFYTFDEGALNTFDLNTAIYYENLYSIKIKKKIKIKTKTLKHVLHSYLPKAQEIDFLNIDAEGHDLSVIISNDWIKYKPKLVMVETGTKSIDEILVDPIYIYLKNLNYKLVAKSTLTSFFMSY